MVEEVQAGKTRLLGLKRRGRQGAEEDVANDWEMSTTWIIPGKSHQQAPCGGGGNNGS